MQHRGAPAPPTGESELLIEHSRREAVQADALHASCDGRRAAPPSCEAGALDVHAGLHAGARGCPQGGAPGATSGLTVHDQDRNSKI